MFNKLNAHSHYKRGMTSISELDLDTLADLCQRSRREYLALEDYITEYSEKIEEGASEGIKSEVREDVEKSMGVLEKKHKEFVKCVKRLMEASVASGRVVGGGEVNVIDGSDEDECVYEEEVKSSSTKAPAPSAVKAPVPSATKPLPKALPKALAPRR